MAYKFKASDRTVQRAVRRIAREQIDGALHAIDSSDRDTARHEVRKACKKIRALVRLIRPSFSGYARENGEYRDIAGLLAGTRDARVLLDTFDMLTRDTELDGDLAMALSVREYFSQQLADAEQGDAASEQLDEARDRLQKARRRVASWTVDEDGWSALGPGLAKILKQAEKAARKVRRKPPPVQTGLAGHDEAARVRTEPCGRSARPAPRHQRFRGAPCRSACGGRTR